MGFWMDFKHRNDKSYQIDEKLKKGKITFDEALDEVSVLFSNYAFNFWEQCYFIVNESNKYNEWIPSIEESVELLLNGKGTGLDKILIERHKNMPSEMRDGYFNRNELSLKSGYWALSGLRGIGKIAGQDINIADFLMRSFKPEIIERVKAKNTIKLNPNNDYFSANQLKLFYEYCIILEESLVDDEPTCFNEYGQIVNKEGKLAEPDYFAELKPVDYKGF